MASLDEINALLSRLGPDEPDVNAVVQLASGNTVVRYDDIDVEFDFDEALNRLMLQADIGPIPAQHKERLLTAIMSYGLLWRQTGAVRMAMGAENHIIIMADLFGGEVDAQVLAAVLGNFTTKARIWRNVIANGEAPAREDPLASEMSFGIRV